MRKYDDPVEVRRGMVPGPGGRQEGPEQFLWRGRLWKVCDVVAHWVETGPWWQSRGAEAVHGTESLDPVGAGSASAGASGSAARGAVDGPAGGAGGAAGGGVGLATPVDLLAEREVWRVEAARGLAAADAGRGMFDLVLDWTDGSWQLTRCAD